MIIKDIQSIKSISLGCSVFLQKMNNRHHRIEKKIYIPLVLIWIVLFTSWCTPAFAQTIIMDGYAFESDNRGYLNNVRIYILDINTGEIVVQGVSDLDGHFEVEIPTGQYILSAEKDLFQPYTKTISTEGVAQGGKMFEKVQMYRKPGYIFDVTLAQVRDSIDAPTDGVQGAWIEIYNNTTKETIFNLKDYPHPHFKFTFEKGNHYTMLIRHKDYFTKRLEAYVDVDNCILCFEGIGDIRPMVTDNLTAGLEMGTLLANIELQPADIGDKITLQNIYYDYNESFIRDDAALELDKLIQVLMDNPAIVIELSSHTDSRGEKEYNGNLSFARAKSAVQYLVAHGIEERRITPRGYGENSLVNDCSDGVQCTEEQHQENRRTELKVLGFLSKDPLADKTLAEIKEDEQFNQLLYEVQNQTIIQVDSGQAIPSTIKSDIEEATKDQKNDTPNQGKDGDSSIDQHEEMKVEEESDLNESVDQVVDRNADSDQYFIQILPSDYSGFKVQIMSVTTPVDPSHPLFSANKNVVVEKTENGYAYLLGHFVTRPSAEEYMTTKVKNKYSDAFIVYYLNGKRINK